MTRIPTLGVLLAGGLARRLGGGDKAMRIVGGRTLLARVIERVTPQCDALILNANGDPSRLAQFDLPVVADTIEGHAGPLAGVLTALDWCADNRPATAWVLSVATDCPFLPHDLAARLHDAIASSNARFAAAASGGQTHHTIGLWPVDARAELRHALAVEGLRKISAWTARYRLATVEWPMTPVDPFFNANTEDEIVTAEQLARRE